MDYLSGLNVIIRFLIKEKGRKESQSQRQGEKFKDAVTSLKNGGRNQERRN